MVTVEPHASCAFTLIHVNIFSEIKLIALLILRLLRTVFYRLPESRCGEAGHMQQTYWPDAVRRAKVDIRLTVFPPQRVREDYRKC